MTRGSRTEPRAGAGEAGRRALPAAVSSGETGQEAAPHRGAQCCTEMRGNPVNTR